MSRTLAQLKTKITSRLHGTTLNKISDFYTICEDAAEMVLGRIDPQETARQAALPSPVYDRVYDYALPADFKSPKDLNLQANGDFVNNDSLSRTYSRQLTNQKKNNSFAINWKEGVQFMRFVRNINFPMTVDPCDSLTENGAWSVGSDASNLELDTINFVSGNGSLRADVASGGAFVNLIIRIGNNSSNYVHKTITTGHFDSIAALWNLIRFDLSTATEVGTVDWANIDYIRVTMTHNTNRTAYFEKTLTEAIDLSDNYEQDGSVFLYFFLDSITTPTLIRLDTITANLGTLFNVTYYSNYLFRSSAGTWKAKPTADSDIINLSPVSYKIFEAEVSRIIAQQIQGAMGQFDYAYWNRMLEGDGEDNNDRVMGLYDQYMLQFPSERIEGSIDYYNVGSELDDIYSDHSVNGQPLSYYS